MQKQGCLSGTRPSKYDSSGILGIRENGDLASVDETLFQGGMILLGISNADVIVLSEAKFCAHSQVSSLVFLRSNIDNQLYNSELYQDSDTIDTRACKAFWSRGAAESATKSML
jgi:hypothetical protein